MQNTKLWDGFAIFEPCIFNFTLIKQGAEKPPPNMAAAKLTGKR